MNKTIDITKIPTFYINLEEKIDRKENMEFLLKKLEFSNFKKFDGVKAEGRSVGCSTSHKNVLEYIEDYKLKINVLKKQAVKKKNQNVVLLMI